MIARQILLAVHIFLGIVWVGGVLFIGWGVYPATKAIALHQQRLFFLSLMKWSHRIFTIIGIGVIVTGGLLGTILGPIRNWDVLLHSAYGQNWLAALVVAVMTLGWGVFVGYRYAIRVFSNETLWQQAEKGHRTPLAKSLLAIAAIETVEVGGFITIIFFMVLL